MLSTRQLESIGFAAVLDSVEVMTPYGAELLRRPRFYARGEAEELIGEQENVRKLLAAVRNDPEGISAVTRLLMPVKDVRRSITGLGERTLSEVELFEIKRFLLELELIAPKVEALGLGLEEIRIYALPEALDTIDPDGTRSPSFYVSDRLSERLAGIRRERKKVDEAMKSGDRSAELMILRTRLAAEEEDENARVRGLISEKLKAFRDDLLENAASIGRFDLALGKARLACGFGAMIPEVFADEFRLTGMTNPKFQKALEEKGRAFVPVSLSLEKGAVVLTGANMGGKSFAIKTLALNAMLAMCGFPVFASEARLPFLDDIRLLSGDSEDAEGGLSSFGGEMKAFDGILRETAGKECVLVMLDEFARGTNPHEGAALVRAAAKLFNERSNTYAVIATHFDGIARLARLHYQVAGLRNADAEKLKGELRAGGENTLSRFMDYGLYPVSKDEEPPRDAVKIIRALGVSGEFTSLIDIE